MSQLLLSILIPTVVGREDERWSDIIISGETLPYMISDYGRVYIKNSKKVAKPSLDTSGYPQIVLSHNGARISKKVHVLVATAFVDGKEAGKQVNHKDGIKANAYYKNLEWVTPKENKHHADINGLWKPFDSFTHPKSIKVINKETGTVYPSISYAERELGIKKIAGMLNGERVNKTKFEYYYGN